ncbi:MULTISPECIES: tyrosine-type recombinase/integrase [Pseudomonas]|uniref:tyrosine-type recombinase/integrase n=1 Tax=Pseudomonas TaxID=286 RepID=UPI002114B8A1|nr:MULTISPECIES: tyrosine-type recombinase/integrase [unclassified Pseudomonas]MCV2227316.1 tyrosine-type recombinase/integrase [Pseudomonas sp. AU10]
MTISQEILSTLKAYHLDNPEATWDELRERLIDIAESSLTMAFGDSSLVAYEMINDEHYQALREASAKMPLSVNQQRAVSKALEIIEASQERMKGRAGRLVEIVEGLKAEGCSTPEPLSPSLSVLPSKPMTFKTLSGLYMEERKEHVEASTMRDVKSSCKVIAEILGDLDMKTHTREDMKNLRAKLLEDRVPSTVKKILTRLSTVMDWAVNNDYITKALTNGLKPTKGADSSREAFSQDQIKALMGHAKTLPADSWLRWALSLGVIAGTRIEELRQLTKADVKQVAGVWVIDINRNDGKTAKTKNALRVIPLTDGAYGFDLQAFREFVDKADSQLFSLGAGQFSVLLNGALREVLSLKADRTQTFHSLRHSLAGALKSVATQKEINEAILGHAAGSISNDLYGAGASVQVGRMAGALKTALL